MPGNKFVARNTVRMDLDEGGIYIDVYLSMYASMGSSPSPYNDSFTTFKSGKRVVVTARAEKEDGRLFSLLCKPVTLIFFAYFFCRLCQVAGGSDVGQNPGKKLETSGCKE